MNAIETKNLSKEYVFGWRKSSRLQALDSLNLNVEEGQIYGFLGPNGAGKSTTIKLLLGLITPTAGDGQLFGVPIYKKEARIQVGFLPEDPSFCTYLTAEEFLQLCGKVLHMDRPERKKRILETLAMVGLEQKAKTKIAEFSRGMLQRIGLAQALLNMPRLVVLDEPLNGLDPYGRKELKNILLKQKAEGKTVFFSSHILSDVQEMCDQVAVLNRGKLIASGKINELLPVKGIKLQVADFDMKLMGQLEKLCSSISRENNHWTFKLSSPAQKEETMAILRKNGTQSIESTTAVESLEEFFFRSIEEDNEHRGFASKETAAAAAA